jgi:hypothetical protein
MSSEVPEKKIGAFSEKQSAIAPLGRDHNCEKYSVVSAVNSSGSTLLVAATCGAAPARNAVTMDACIAFLHCQDATANRYWMIVCVAVGVGVGYAARAWLKREAKRDAAKDRELDAEMERVPAANEHHGV